MRQIELKGNVHVQAQNSKTPYRTCQRRPPLPLRTDIFEDFPFDTAAAEQNNHQSVTLSQTKRATAHVSAVCVCSSEVTCT